MKSFISFKKNKLILSCICICLSTTLLFLHKSGNLSAYASSVDPNDDVVKYCITMPMDNCESPATGICYENFKMHN